MQWIHKNALIWIRIRALSHGYIKITVYSLGIFFPILTVWIRIQIRMTDPDPQSCFYGSNLDLDPHRDTCNTRKLYVI